MNHCGYYRKCTDEPSETNFFYADFRHALQNGNGQLHYDILTNRGSEADGVVYEGMTYIRASPEQAMRIGYYNRIYNH